MESLINLLKIWKFRLSVKNLKTYSLDKLEIKFVYPIFKNLKKLGFEEFVWYQNICSFCYWVLFLWSLNNTVLRLDTIISVKVFWISFFTSKIENLSFEFYFRENLLRFPNKKNFPLFFLFRQKILISLYRNIKVWVSLDSLTLGYAFIIFLALIDVLRKSWAF